MDIKQLTTFFTQQGAPAFRLKQTLTLYYQQPITSWDEVSVLPVAMRAELAQHVLFTTVTLIDSFETDDVVKCVFELGEGGHKVEAVIMKHKDDRRTLCLSCQAGCPMACNFCATGTLGLQKNLSAGEMVDIVRAAQQVLRQRGEYITNIVYMGMGEPFANYAAVKESLHLIHDYFDIGWRKISVSTCGIVPKILEFAKDFPQVNLAISLHAANDEKRSRMMPINDRFSIELLMKTCREYIELTNRKIFFEYLVIDEFNDTIQDARELAQLLNHPLYHLNLIRFHATDAVRTTYGVAWKAPTRERLQAFMDELERLRVPVTLRRSFGERIDAACGMLALKHNR